MQHAVERELLRFIVNEPNLPVEVNMREFPHPAFRGGSVVATVGAPFFFAGAMFSFVISVGSVVAERETKLRQAMEGMGATLPLLCVSTGFLAKTLPFVGLPGLRRSGWWFTWMVTELLMVLLSSLLMCFFGMMLQFDMFLKNSFMLPFMLIFLFQLAMLGLAFLLSTLTSKAASATNVGFIVFLFGFVIQLVVQFGFPFNTEFESYWQFLFGLFPPALLSKGLGDLGRYTSQEESVGLSWSERASYCEEVRKTRDLP